MSIELTYESFIQYLSSLSKEQRTNINNILNNSDIRPTENLTIVTGLWDIGRPGRPFTHYIENFEKFLQIPVNMFIYVPKSLEHIVWKHRNPSNTYVRIFELEDIKQLYSPFWEKTQEIRNNLDWINSTGEHGWLKNSPQATVEWYNPIVQSKMFMLHDAKIMNSFNTDYFIWLDAGITNTVYDRYLVDDRCFDKIIPHLNSFLFLSYPYKAVDEIHGFDYKAMKRYARKDVNYVCRGGLFGGHKEFISQANATYYHLLLKTLNDGYMGTEESIFSIMAHLEPNVYRRYALDDNGMIVKFIEALLNDTVEVENVPEIKLPAIPKGIYNSATDKTSLYVLGFNFPKQFETLLKSFEEVSDWLDKPRKILINNSNDDSAIKEYDILCKKYNFEHIITGENLGINRGRFFAAEHFENSDSDYYFFFEDDMCLHSSNNTSFCRNGFRHYVPDLYKKVHQIMAKEQFDFLKLSFTEVYMDNHVQVSWYNVPQAVRTELWPHYDKLPEHGLDPNCPRTIFKTIDNVDNLSYITGDIYYANWPMIMNKMGNKKVFLETVWDYPYEQTWMSYVHQKTIAGYITPAVLLASPINHNRIVHYTPEERREC